MFLRKEKEFETSELNNRIRPCLQRGTFGYIPNVEQKKALRTKFNDIILFAACRLDLTPDVNKDPASQNDPARQKDPASKIRIPSLGDFVHKYM